MKAGRSGNERWVEASWWRKVEELNQEAGRERARRSKPENMNRIKGELTRLPKGEQTAGGRSFLPEVHRITCWRKNAPKNGHLRPEILAPKDCLPVGGSG